MGLGSPGHACHAQAPWSGQRFCDATFQAVGLLALPKGPRYALSLPSAARSPQPGQPE